MLDRSVFDFIGGSNRAAAAVAVAIAPLCRSNPATSSTNNIV
jgi:hypothetical protein